MKLKKDFGVNALLGVMVLGCSFLIIGYMVVTKTVSGDAVLTLVGGWVGAVLGAFLVIKSQKNQAEIDQKRDKPEAKE